MLSLRRRLFGMRGERNDNAGRGEISVLGATLHAGFQAGEANALTGQRIESPADLAALAQVYRDPRFETFRAIYVKDGKVVGEAGYTSRLPAAVALPKDLGDQIRADLDRFGADGYYMLHNHPSGSATPSVADLQLTNSTARDVAGFLGHVVIDHNEYAVIRDGGKVQKFSAPELAATDYRENPAVKHMLLRASVTNPRQVVQLGKALQIKGDHATLVLMSGNLTNLIVDVPTSMLQAGDKASIAKMKAIMRRMARESGSGHHRFMILPEGAGIASFSAFVTEGVVTDVVSADGRSLREQGTPYYGDFLNENIPVKRVAEEESPYRPGDSEQQFRDTERAYGGREAYERAKAAGKTKLNYRQWVQVRTPNFKAFFGDWESVRARTDLQQMNSVKTRFDAAFNADFAQAKAQSRAEFKKLSDATERDGFGAVASDGRLIKFSGRGFKEVAQHAADRRVLAVAANLKSLFESAVPLYSTKPDSEMQQVSSFHYYGVKADFIERSEAYVLLEVIERTNGDFFYDADATSIEEIRAATSAPLANQTKSGAGDIGAARKGRLAQWWQGVNPETVSKVTDPDTSEPMVMYHGTSKDNDFDKFKVGPRGSWFTSNQEVASDYAEENDSQSSPYNPDTRRYDPVNTASRVLPVYLNIRSPYRLKGDDFQKVNVTNYAKGQRELFKSIQGHDGVLWNDNLNKEWVVLGGKAQVKSAIGNTGTFDATDPRIQRRRTDNQTENGLSPEQFREALVARFGEKGVAALEAQGLLNIASKDESQPGNPAWYEDGKAFFVPEFHADAESAIGSVLHEVGAHHGLPAMLGDAGWRALKGRIVALAREGDYVRAVWDGVVDTYPEFEGMKGKAPSMYVITDKFMHEVIAKIGETAAGRKSSIWRDILAAVNHFLLKMGFTKQINKNELADLVEGALKRTMAGKTLAGAGGEGRMDMIARRSDLLPIKAEADQYRRDVAALMSSLRTNIPPIKVMTTPPVLRMLGAESLPITISRDTIRKATNEIKHNVTMEAIERLPEEIANPVMVFESATEKGSLVVLTEYKDKSGRSVMVATSLSRDIGRGYVVNRIDSAYGRPGAEYMAFVGRGLLRYRNTAKSLDWVRDGGLQLPKAGSPSRGFWDSVPTEDDVVNGRSEPDRMNRISFNPADYLPGVAPRTSEAFTDLSDVQRDMLNKIGRGPAATLKDWVREKMERIMTKVRQGLVDRYAALKELDEQALGKDFIDTAITSSSWVLARMSASAAGALHAMLNTGRVEFNKQQRLIGLKDGDTSGGLSEVLHNVGDAAEVARFFAWMAANRSDAIVKRHEKAVRLTAEAKTELGNIKASDIATQQEAPSG